MRLTKDVVASLLKENEGFTANTSYSSRNFSESVHYKIEGGQLKARRQGKTSWADSRYDRDEVCDIDQARRFLRKFLVKD